MPYGRLLLPALVVALSSQTAAEAHNPTMSGTVQYGTGGTAGGAYGNTSVTMTALYDSGCANTDYRGQETNGLDGAVLPAADLVAHTLRLTWQHKGNTGNFGAASLWVTFLDSACKPMPPPKGPVNAQYLTDRSFVVPAGAKWLALQPESGVPGVDWKIVAKHPAKPRKKR